MLNEKRDATFELVCSEDAKMLNAPRCLKHNLHKARELGREYASFQGSRDDITQKTSTKTNTIIVFHFEVLRQGCRVPSDESAEKGSVRLS